jgi:RNA polymerase sigma-70 factor (ECF subfamily)
VSYLPEIDLGERFVPFALFRESFGFVPSLFRAQTLLPGVIEAEARVAGAVLLKPGALTRLQKEAILLAGAAAKNNTYCVTAHWNLMRALGEPEVRLDQIALDHRRAGLPPSDAALLDFSLKLSRNPTSVHRGDYEALRRQGLSDEQILEGVLVTALTEFLCTLSVGLGAIPDFEPRRLPSRTPGPPKGNGRDQDAGPAREAPAPYLKAVDLGGPQFPPFALLQKRFGFIPNIFRAQTLRPDVLEAETALVDTVLLSENHLSRVQKEYVLLVISAANLNTYCVAVHCEMLHALGVPVESSDQVAVDHRRAGLSAADTALLDCALKLARRPGEFGRGDIDALRRHGFTDEQILESVAMASMTNFLNTLQMGLGTTPDVEPRRVFRAAPAPAAGAPPATAEAGVDQDAGLVALAQSGDLGAFETLALRHHGRIYRTLVGITGDPRDAEDCVQEAFLKVFEHLGEFRGTARFSTWLTRIAINEGLMRLRARKPVDSLDEAGPDDEEFRPREIRAWVDDPEQHYSKAQIRALVEQELTRLPARYRVVVTLRDMEQLTTEEAAEALGLSLTALRSRLHRGRLMLREALAPHFTERVKDASR